MDKILIGLRPPSSAGRIYYSWDPQIEQQILFLKSIVTRRQRFNVNVDNQVLFSIDANNLLKSIEVLISRKAWTVEEDIEKPKANSAFDIEFSNLKKERTFIELPIKVSTNIKFSYALISMGVQTQSSFWIALSDQCLAKVTQSSLEGIFAELFAP